LKVSKTVCESRQNNLRARKGGERNTYFDYCPLTPGRRESFGRNAREKKLILRGKRQRLLAKEKGETNDSRLQIRPKSKEAISWNGGRHVLTEFWVSDCNCRKIRRTLRSARGGNKTKKIMPTCKKRRKLQRRRENKNHNPNHVGKTKGLSRKRGKIGQGGRYSSLI